MPAPPVLERLKDRTAQQLRHYLIRPTANQRAFRLWKFFDEWKPIKEFATQQAAEDHLFDRLPKIAGCEGPLRR